MSMCVSVCSPAPSCCRVATCVASCHGLPRTFGATPRVAAGGGTCAQRIEGELWRRPHSVQICSVTPGVFRAPRRGPPGFPGDRASRRGGRWN
eukprot:10390666-Lingulodinium_polyedra.AAC.1